MCGAFRQPQSQSTVAARGATQASPASLPRRPRMLPASRRPRRRGRADTPEAVLASAAAGARTRRERDADLIRHAGAAAAVMLGARTSHCASSHAAASSPRLPAGAAHGVATCARSTAASAGCTASMSGAASVRGLCASGVSRSWRAAGDRVVAMHQVSLAEGAAAVEGLRPGTDGVLSAASEEHVGPEATFGGPAAGRNSSKSKNDIGGGRGGPRKCERDGQDV